MSVLFTLYCRLKACKCKAIAILCYLAGHQMLTKRACGLERVKNYHLLLYCPSGEVFFLVLMPGVVSFEIAF